MTTWKKLRLSLAIFASDFQRPTRKQAAVMLAWGLFMTLATTWWWLR